MLLGVLEKVDLMGPWNQSGKADPDAYQAHSTVVEFGEQRKHLFFQNMVQSGIGYPNLFRFGIEIVIFDLDNYNRS